MSSFDFTSFGDAKIAVVRPIDVRREQEGVRHLNQEEKGDDSSKQHRRLRCWRIVRVLRNNQFVDFVILRGDRGGSVVGCCLQ